MLKVPASERSGLVISAAVHTAVLVGTLVAFSDAPKFEDAQESIPVEIITDSELSQIMRGNPDGEKRETPSPRVDAVAETEQQRPQPPTPEAKRDVPTPPPPLQRQPDPGEAEPAPPQVAAVTPPPRPPEPPPPEPPKPEPPKPEPVQAPEPPRPAPPEKAEAEPVPVPPRRPPELKVAEAKPEAPKPEPPKPRTDEVARLLEQKKAEEQRAAARPRSGDQQQPQRRYDPSEISRLVSRETAQRTGSTGREPQRTASLGAPTANAPSMSPSMWNSLDGLLTQQYKQCWSNPSLGGGPIYVPQIRVIYKADGSLAQPPVLVNPPSDPMLRSIAESALRAVRMCDPLRIPAQYQPYYQQWRARTLRFDPAEMG